MLPRRAARAPGASRTGDESALAIARRPETDALDFGTSDSAVTAVPVGIGADLPARGHSWGKDGTLVLIGSGARREVRASSWGIIEIATRDRRFGSLVVGTGPDAPPLGPADRRLLVRPATRS